MEPLTPMPNLPHFRTNKPKLRGRGGDFKFTEGAPFFEQVCTTLYKGSLTATKRCCGAHTMRGRGGSAPMRELTHGPLPRGDTLAVLACLVMLYCTTGQ